MLPALLVVISFVLGMRNERNRALVLSAVVALTGISLVIVMSFIESTDFFDTASGYLQLVAGFVACLAAALAGNAWAARRRRA